MARSKVFVTRLIPEAGLEPIRAACEAEVWSEPLPPPRDVLLQKVADCDGLLALLTERIDGELLDAAPRLKVVSNYAVGFNNIDVPAATSRGVRIGNTPGVLTEATADLAVALLLAAARRIVESHTWALEGHWKTWEPRGFIGQDLGAKTLGVLGMGRIGLSVARKLYWGWGMNVIYCDPHENREAQQQFGARRVDFDALLSEADFLSIHADLNDTTRGLFNAKAFRKMKPTAVFVNTARGPLVVEADLLEALQKGTIFAAGLDVTDPEPPDPASPLLRQPNCVVVPHIASATVTSRNGMAEIAAANLLAGLRGEPLPHWVNPQAADHTR